MATIVKVEAILNGQTYNLTKGSGNEWSATQTAPTQTSGSNNSGQGPGVGANAQGKGYYPVTIRITDDFGNVTEVDSDDSTWGQVLRLKVLEKTLPTANLLYPTEGALIKSSRPTVKFTITDAGSGPNSAECYVSIDSKPAVKVTGTVLGSVCTVEYTPDSNIGDGAHTVSVYGKDFDGNQATAVTANFTIDTTPPTLNVTNPASETTKTNKTSITVVGTTNDDVSSPVVVKITGGVETYTPAVSGGAFSQVVQLRNNATNTLTITATDSAGLATTVTRTVIVNTTPPSITEIALTPNPVDGGKTLVISLTARSA